MKPLAREGREKEPHAHILISLSPHEWSELMTALDATGVSLSTFLVTALLIQARRVPASISTGGGLAETN
ncbi:MAG: hypothetical protein RBU30_12615 [Polyangia bacterium]|jgi:hypothetical protein|nr:hypothetical protein [Polyangia bacterium]